MSFRNPVTSVGVIGTVTTASSSSAPASTTVAVRGVTAGGSSSGSASAPLTLALPPNTAAGDLLVLIGSVAAASGTFSAPGFTAVDSVTSSSETTTVLTKPATASNVTAGSVTVTCGTSSSTGVYLLAISGCKLVSRAAHGDYNATNPVSTGMATAGAVVVAFAALNSSPGGTWNWPSYSGAATGGPPSTQPALTTLSNAYAGTQWLAYALANWSTSAAYSWQITYASSFNSASATTYVIS